MPFHPSRLRSLYGLTAVVFALALAACDQDVLTAPEPAPDGPALAHVGLGEPPLAPGEFVVPEWALTAEGWRSAGEFISNTGGERHATDVWIPAGVWLQVKVEGTNWVETGNPYELSVGGFLVPSHHPFVATPVGPMGVEFVSSDPLYPTASRHVLRTWVTIVPEDGQGYATDIGPSDMEGDTSVIPDRGAIAIRSRENSYTRVKRVASSGRLRVSRSLFDSWMRRLPVGYRVRGNPRVSWRVFEGLGVEAGATQVKAGTEVEFRAHTEGEFTRTYWWYAVGDTLEGERRNSEIEWFEAEACRDRATCDYAPPASGRMYVSAQLRETRNTYHSDHSEIIQVEADRELAVRVVADRQEMHPVLDRTFNAVTQYWSDPAQPPRSDMVNLTVQTWWEPSGEPAEGVEVRLVSEPVEGSGGHPHTGRPAGDLFRDGENPQVKRRVRDALTLTTDAEGRASAVYRTSGVSGVEEVRAVAASDGQTAEHEVEVTVRWPGLVAMPRSGSFHYFTDQSHTRHGDINHFADPVFAQRVLALFQEYFAAREEPRFIGGETRFAVTEASLEWGGLFDVGGSHWRPPHRTHRTGRDMDVRYWSMDARQRDQFMALCENHQIICEPHPNNSHPISARDYHFHLRPGA